MELDHFDLNLLRTLDALLVERNVTRAAERLKISQPAMSGALKRLRRNFNDELLVRIGHVFELTPLAQTLAGPVRELLSRIQQTLSIQPEFDPYTSARTFRIASSDYVAAVILKPLAHTFATQFPGLSLAFEPMSEATATMLMTGALDLCITIDKWIDARSGGNASQLVRRKLFTDHYVCVVDRGNRDIGQSITLEELARIPHVGVKLAPVQGHLFEEDWSKAGIAPRIALCVPSFTGALQMVAGTPFLSVVPRRLAEIHAADGKIRMIPSPVELGALNEFVAWHTRQAKDPCNLFLRQWLDRTVARCLVPAFDGAG